MGAALAIHSSFSSSNESIFDRLDTFSDVSNTLDTLVLLFPGHLTPIDHFSCLIFFDPKKNHTIRSYDLDL